jgi:hypothetical protein
MEALHITGIMYIRHTIDQKTRAQEPMKKKRRMLSYATTTSNKNSLLGTDRARQEKNNTKGDDYRHGASRSGRLEQSKGGRRMMGREKKFRIKR